MTIFHPTPRQILRRPIDDAVHSNLTGFPDVLRRVYAARTIDDAADLDHSLGRLPPPDLLDGIAGMVDILADAIRHNRRITVLADFDADGATSCAVAIRGLRALGAERIDYLVPNRFEYGYGLTPEIVEAIRPRTPDVLLTVDNGISSLDGVTAAKRLGWTVLITDHHLPGRELPNADAIVNPNMAGDRFPGKALAGVGVMFYVLGALRSHLRTAGWFGADRTEPNLAELLDYVALGTVADVVPFDRVNRILVEQGLKRIRAGRAHPGLRALLGVAGRNAVNLTAEDLAFAVGPRLNAAGRLEDMSLGIECLLADDMGPATEHAAILDSLNRDRREIERQMKADALDLIARLEQSGTCDHAGGLCLFDESWHQGVVGLLASRLKDRLNRPVIAFARGSNGELKGSARSTPDLHIRDLLSDLATQHPGLLNKFGGHAMAAGLSLREDRLEAFRELFQELVAERLGAPRATHPLASDGELGPAEFRIETAELLRMAGPWGQSFPEPLFDGDFIVRRRSIVGREHLKFTLEPPGSGIAIDAIAFFVESPERWLDCDHLRVAYRLDVNEYRGARTLQLKIDYMESAAAPGDAR
ncbi:MAG: single-stranded-DNA-specific exonuclease RecJ [Methylotetracoccus sp.]